ncbi:MAG: OmpA family protein [Bacteroidota bacterium]
MAQSGFFNRLTPFGRLVVAILFVFGVWGLKWLVLDSGYILKKATVASAEIEKVALPDAARTSGASVAPVPMPSSSPAKVGGPEVRWLLWAWNAQMGLMFANGGAETTEGSLMAKNGVNLHLTRQDDVPQMQASLIKFAGAYKDDPNTKEGTHFVSIMGDGAAAFLAGVNPELERLGPDYRAQIIYTCGKSLGEDKFMGPPEWKENPQAARGGVCAAVLRDGDWNIVIKWCSDNGIKVNPDETTYDPEAMNFVAADNYLDAGEKYINGYSEERDVVRNGQRAGEKKKVAVNSVTTWTPGDVNVAEKKGGLVSIVSTKEYRSQMPCVVIGIKKWMEENRKTVENMILSIGQGGDQVKANPAALDKAGDISAKVYNEENKDYWVKYYKGTTVADKRNLVVELGGSTVHNVADNLEIFGLNEGSTNVVKIVYKLFGDIVVKLYPKLVPSYPSPDQIIDVSYLRNVASGHKSDVTVAEKPKFNADQNVTQKVSEKSWNIEFETGSATLTPAAKQVLETLFNDLVVAGGLKVEVHGHTDNVGDPAANMNLSEKRAFAIRKWLEDKSPSNFPEGRVNVFAHGQSNPVAPNDTPVGRAKNRRVNIVLGK